jgi:GntR family transcriptional repressor for pyruvate dehydrogenase complex
MPTGSNLFRPLNTKRAFDEISDQIRELIYSGVFKPGDKLPSERELGNQFKTGRMVVREALRTLEQAGLIYIKQGSSGGAFIRHADGKVITSSISDMIKIGNVSLEELTEARLGIEKIVLELSINKITRDDLHLLENNIKDSEEQISKAIRPLDSHLKFHLLLAKCTNNMLFERIVESIMKVTESFLTQVVPDRIYLNNILGYHKEILQAIKQGDLYRAQEQMQSHLRDLKYRLLEISKPEAEVEEAR